MSVHEPKRLPAWNTASGLESKFAGQEDEEPCVICHDEMLILPAVTLKCGHKFHDRVLLI